VAASGREADPLVVLSSVAGAGGHIDAVGDTGAAGEQHRRMRAGVRARVAEATRRAGRGFRRISPAGLTALLCAGAFGPVVVALPGSGAQIAASVGVLGSVGANVLTSLVEEVVDRLRADGRSPAQAEIEQALAQRIEEVLQSGGTPAASLRSEVAAVLREIGAVRAVLEEVVETGDVELQYEVALAFTTLSEKFDDFGFLLTDVREAVALILGRLVETEAERRADSERLRWQSTQLRLLREDISRLDRHAGTESDGRGGSAAEAPRWTGCPYQGLWPFETEHSEVFYGREHLSAELVGKLAECLSGRSIVVVTGASGAGKSSLLRAGLIPMLAHGALGFGSEEWPRVLLTLTRAPLEELAIQLAVLGGTDVASVRRDLAEDPGQAHLLVRRALLAHLRASPDGAGAVRERLMLVVDHFEKIFTFGDDETGRGEAERQAFITALGAAAGTPCGPADTPPALVVLSVRGDFWERCAAYPQLTDALRDGQFVVGPMSEPELRRAITGPAAAARLEIEAGLVDDILAELRAAGTTGGYEAGALPLLSQAMLLTWENRTGDRLTRRGYGLSGGVAHAVRTSADGVYEGLDAPRQAVAAEVFRRMVVISADGRLARRTMRREDLYAGRPAEQIADVDAMLGAFTDRRLVILSQAAAEIAHDVLLTAWPRLSAWVEEDRRSLLVRQRLGDAARYWSESGQDDSALYRGARLAEAREWAAGRTDLTALEDRFLRASTAAAETALMAECRRVRRLRRLVAGQAALLVVALVAATVAFQERGTARERQAEAVSRARAAESALAGRADPRRAMMLAVLAWRTSPTVEARGAVLSAQMLAHAGQFGDTEGSSSVAISPAGDLVVTGGVDGAIRLWDARTHRQRASLRGRANVATVMRFSPDGTMLAASTADGHVAVWATSDGRALASPRWPALKPVAWRPDGQALALACAAPGGVVVLRQWDPRSGRLLTEFPAPGTGTPGTRAGLLSGLASSLAYSPDGEEIAIGHADGTAALYRLRDGRRIATLRGHADPSEVRVAFSPDGTLATGGVIDGRVLFWDASGRSRGAASRQVSDPVGALAFAGTDRLIAVGGDRKVRIWDLRQHSWDTDSFARPAGGTLLDVGVSTDGRLIAAAGPAGSTVLWRRANTWLNTTGDDAAMTGVAFDHSGERLAAVDGRGGVSTWDVTGLPPKPLLTAPSNAALGKTGVAYDRDGALAATSKDTVRLFDTAGRERADLHVGRGLAAAAVAFSPDGTLLAATAIPTGTLTGGGNAVYVWDARTLRRRGVIDLGTYRSDRLAFSPDGARLLAAATAHAAQNPGRTDSLVRIWRTTDLAAERSLPTGQDQVVGISVSHDGRTLATAGSGRVIKLWDLPTGRLRRTFADHPSSIRDVAFSPDDRTLATGTQGDTVIRLWNVSTGRHVADLTGHLGVLNRLAFSPHGNLLATASVDGSVGVWDTDPSLTTRRICAALAGPTLTGEWKALGVKPQAAPCR
jgi:WD40 repeat protein